MTHNFFKKVILRDWLFISLAGLILFAVFFASRLYHLTIIPVFADEAIYIRWSQVMKSEPSLRFLPLSDGKQPLFMWLLMPILSFFKDPLFAGRFLSVLSGSASLVGLAFLTFLITRSIKTSFFTAFLYLILPYAFFLDRVALVDSLLMAFGIWTFIFTFLLMRFRRLDLAILTGMILGGGLITKSPALFFALLMPISLLLLNFRQKSFFKTLLKYAALFLVAYVFAFCIYNLLRLGPNFQMLSSRNQDYVFSIKEILKHPLDPLLVHLRDISHWFPNLFTWPVLIFSTLGIFIGLLDKKKRKISLVLLAWFVIPVMVQSSFARVFTPRYLFWTIFPLFVFGAFSFEFLWKKFKDRPHFALLMILLLTVLPLRYNYLLATDPQRAPLSEPKRSGYLEKWTSGYGIVEVRDYLVAAAEKDHLNVGTEGYFGTLPDGLQIYFDKDSRVTIFGVGLGLTKIPDALIESADKKEARTFLVVNQSRMKVGDPRLELIFKVPKAVGKTDQDYLLFYEVK